MAVVTEVGSVGARFPLPCHLVWLGVRGCCVAGRTGRIGLAKGDGACLGVRAAGVAASATVVGEASDAEIRLELKASAVADCRRTW